MALPRALRKWTERNPEGRRPYAISIELWDARAELTDDQLRMGKGAETVWREVQQHFAGKPEAEDEIRAARLSVLRGRSGIEQVAKPPGK
jgi:hypothetical protein